MKIIENGVERDMTADEAAEHAAWQEAQTDPVPQSVTLFQGRAALIRTGHFGAVKAFAQAEGGEVWEAFEYANHWYRHGAFVTQLAPQLGLTEADVDDLFRLAATIEA